MKFPPAPIPASPVPWTILGDCELYEELGRGGMGIVYRARHRRLGRQLAVKVLRGGELAERNARLRFQAEAEIVAQLQHPGIVTIHDVGEEQGVCWYSMELVPGRTLEEMVRHQPMAAREAATCLRDISSAVEYAHAHGVLHRDLKPSNIILDAEGNPRVTDFGIARRTNAIGALTQTGSILASPGYGAPEQFLTEATDARTDVYGLGGLLYHVLTSRPPFQGPSVEAILMQVRDAEPLAPRQLNPTIPRDLETICLKALAKEPRKRYATAAEFSADLARFLAGQTVLARPITWAGQAWRWCRRRPGLAAAIALAVTALTGGTVISLWQMNQARQSASAAQALEKRAIQSELIARRSLYASTMLQAQVKLREGSPVGIQMLEEQRPSAGQPDLRGWEWDYLAGQLDQSKLLRSEPKAPGEPRCAKFSPDGQRIATVTSDLKGWNVSIHICDAKTMTVQQTLSGYKREVPFLEWHPDGSRLLACDGDGGVAVWEIASAKQLYRVALDPVDRSRYQPPRAAWSPDGQLFAAVSYKTGLTLHQAGDGAMLRTLSPPTNREIMFSWHPAGDRIAIPDAARSDVQILDLQGTTLTTLPQSDAITALAYHPTGTHLAVGTASGQVRIADLTRPESPTITGQTIHGAVGFLLWNQAGDRLFSGGWTGMAGMMDPTTGQVLRYFTGHRGGWITSLSLHENQIISWAKDATLRSWDYSETADRRLKLPGIVTRMQACGKEAEVRGDLHVLDPFGRTAVWQTQGAVQQQFLRWGRAIAWNAEGTKFALAYNLDPAKYGLGALAKLKSSFEIRNLAQPTQPGTPMLKDYRINEILWSPQGDRILLVSGGSLPAFCSIISATDGKELCRIHAAPRWNSVDPFLPSALAWSPDGKRIAMQEGSVLYDATTGQPAPAAKLAEAAIEKSRQELGGPAIAMAWSPDSQRLVMGMSDGGHVWILDLLTGKRLPPRIIHTGWVRSLAWHPDGTRIATAGRDGTIKILDATTLEMILNFTDHAADVRAVTWSQDGSVLISADVDGNVISRQRL